jgi:glyoxylase-like metal-dependent hydrolase (beta-lactamase superfamily II)
LPEAKDKIDPVVPLDRLPRRCPVCTTANVLVTGDLMTNGSYPVIDDSHGMARAIERLLPLVNSETVVVPGHGPIGNRDSLLNFVNMLCTIEGRIRRLISSGSPVAEILAARPTADFDQVWGGGYVTGDIFGQIVLAGLGLPVETKE